MPKVRNGAAKWKRNSSAAAPDYQAGIQQPKKSWAASAADAQDNYAQGTQAAIAEGRYAKGVQQAGDGKWQQRSLGVGVQRYTQGVQASGDAYQRGFAPYQQVIESTDLPARGPRGSQQNYARSQAMGQALNNAKKARTG